MANAEGTVIITECIRCKRNIMDEIFTPANPRVMAAWNARFCGIACQEDQAKDLYHKGTLWWQKFLKKKSK